MNYFLRDNNIDFLHRHCGYRKRLIEVGAYFKDSGEMKSNVHIRCLPDEYESVSARLYEMIFDKSFDRNFEKIYPCKKCKK